jgi:hypothetical protein
MEMPKFKDLWWYHKLLEDYLTFCYIYDYNPLHSTNYNVYLNHIKVINKNNSSEKDNNNAAK